MHVPPGYALFIPSAIRKAVDLPVVGVGRFKDPLQAERALAEGHCDLVGVVRGQIADADFAAKARAGATEEIRLCLSCNQECVGRMGLNRWLGCIENPRTGREAQPVRRDRPRRRRRPTRRARRRRRPGRAAGGDRRRPRRARASTVLEREAEPGGQVRLAASVPNRAELGDMVRNQVTECRRLGVTIELRRRRRPSSVVDARGADHVVVATGAVAAAPVVGRPATSTNACDVRDVLTGAAAARRATSCVIDEIGFHHATSVAELLADRGCAVEVVTPGMVVGQDLGITLDMEQWWIRADAKGIVQSTDLVPMGFDGTTLTLLHHPTGANVERTPGLGRARRAGRARPSSCTSTSRRAGRRRRARRRLRRPAPGPRRRRRGRARRSRVSTRLDRSVA